MRDKLGTMPWDAAAIDETIKIYLAYHHDRGVARRRCGDRNVYLQAIRKLMKQTGRIENAVVAGVNAVGAADPQRPDRTKGSIKLVYERWAARFGWDKTAPFPG